MTTIRIWKKDNNISAVEAYGHAGYAKFGKDIVCSAISILMTNTVNSIESLTDDKIVITADDKTGLIRFVFEGTPSEASILLVKSLLLGLKQIQAEYGNKFIDIIYEEV